MNNRDRINDLRALALAAFESAISHASEGGLWDLHGALEKRAHEVVRGDWGSRGRDEGSAGSHTTACPLNWLYGREAGSLERTIALAERKMAKDGFSARDFYQAWDRGLLGYRELLGRVDRHITARTLGEATRRT